MAISLSIVVGFPTTVGDENAHRFAILAIAIAALNDFDHGLGDDLSNQMWQAQLDRRLC
jgi:hypothetical protein